MRVDAETRLCASIAYPNRATKSPIMHNAAFEALGLNYVYMAFEPTDLAGATQGMRALGIRGFSVSKPYKETIIEYLDEVDDIAKTIGAVNTILNEDGRLRGYNSDWIGAARAIEEIVDIDGKRVAIVGAGGAGRAIAFGLKQKGGDVVIYNRTKARAEKLASEIGVEFGGGLDELDELADYDILINATSVGFYPRGDDTIIPRHRLRRGKVILDVVFNPLETRLIREAREAGCRVALGIRMLVLQGAFQFKLFTGYDPPLDVMQEALEEALTS